VPVTSTPEKAEFSMSTNNTFPEAIEAKAQSAEKVSPEKPGRTLRQRTQQSNTVNSTYPTPFTA
jgi:hypothetical protein